MGINLVIAVTDADWFDQLRAMPDLPEVIFRPPSGGTFKALQPGERFLFKLHAPRNAIVVGGIFAHANTMPWPLAWESFREANGARSAQQPPGPLGRTLSAPTTGHPGPRAGIHGSPRPGSPPRPFCASPPRAPTSAIPA